MDRKRQIALVFSVVAIGLGAGYFVQRDAAVPAPLPKPRQIEPVAADPQEPAVLLPADAPARLEPAPTPAAPEPRTDCSLDLQLMPLPHAMIGVTLVAPCAPESRVVLKHAGLAVTGRASVNGVLIAELPALEPDARVEALLDGQTATARVAMPEVVRLERVAVQWLEDDAFQLNAFENGAAYGAPGHVSGATPHLPPADGPATGGYLTRLGGGDVALPMRAEVYTYPPAGTAEVVIEAEVTAATCGRELLGETIQSRNGVAQVAELSLAMPDCSGIGDIAVLNLSAAGTKLAAQ